MDRFRADLHIHSRYSRATSKSLTPRLLAAWAGIKGIGVLGTGDFTHPGWLAEIEESCREDGSGLLTLKDPAPASDVVPWLPPRRDSSEVRFLLSAEISSIYKRGGRVRKVHNLVFMPSLDAVKRFNLRLSQVGNLASDGRPILGLDSRHVLDLVLSTSPEAFLVPAHVWTPWFSLFGSKSGFDSMEECFGDLAGEIFALETGLSSDPDMNRLLSALDRYRLISNSDAHSGEKLGRELNLFSGSPSFAGIRRALKGEDEACSFLGTVEFFPEEGKYHMDGHRKCGVVLDPRETRKLGGICPVCGQPLTVGVLSRVLELADRSEPAKPEGEPGFTSLIPLPEILAEITGSGVSTKTVRSLYARLLAAFPSEMFILQDAPAEALAKFSPALAEGVLRMRRGKVLRRPGYDGEFGVISVFSPKERREMLRGGSLVTPAARKAPAENVCRAAPPRPAAASPVQPGARSVAYNAAQQEAIEAGPGPVLVLAGPGTGKTQTLLGRILRLLDAGVTPRHVLAVTFTRRAAAELKERLILARGGKGSLPRADTLHALAFEYWKTAKGSAPVLLSEDASRRVFASASPDLPAKALKAAWDAVSLARERLADPAPWGEAALRYAERKRSMGLADYTDLLEFWLERMRSGRLATAPAEVLVDEVQDLSPLQLETVRGLCPPDGRGFFAIGDPNQSIYSFRGALADVRSEILRRWPDCRVVALEENYRSRQAILDLSDGVAPAPAHLVARDRGDAEIALFRAPTDGREASWIGERIRGLIGSTSHTLAGASGTLSPGDIAVLVRFRALIPHLERTLAKFGIPCAVPEAEAFWNEPRVALILQAAAKTLGIPSSLPGNGQPEAALPCPDAVLAKGPEAIAARLPAVPPFDRLFWQGPEFKRLQKAFSEHGGWAGVLSHVALQSELDLVRQKAEKVQIMTLHAAKGLEFEAVFLPALEDGILPFAGGELLTGKAPAWENKPREDEELRLFYVGLTRAKRILCLSHSGRRELYGRSLHLGRSRFLEKLPEDGIRLSEIKARKVRQEKQLTLL